jgi:phenylacetate-CoA ligase
MTLLRFLPRFRKAYRDLEIYKERESWPRQKIESFQLDRINSIWQQAIRHVPYYRDLISQAGLPQAFFSLEEFKSRVPLLPRQTVRDRPLAFFSDQATSGRWHYTGGSTGTPMGIYWGNSAHREVLRAKYRLHDQWGLDIFGKMVFLWGHGASFEPGLAGLLARIKQPVEDRLRRRLRLSAYRLGREDLQGYLRRMAAFQPQALYGYSHAAYLLAQEAERLDFQSDTLKLVIMSAEPVTDRIRTSVEKAFGVPGIVEYGSVECGFTAGECIDRKVRIREDIVFLELIARERENYELALTVLTNHSFPLIRYLIGDVTSSPLEISPVGFAVLGKVEGRDNDLLTSFSGRTIHPTVVEEIFDHTPGVRCYRVVQKGDGSIEAFLELQEKGAQVDTVPLTKKLSKLVEGYPVRVEVVQEVPCLPSGKHRWVISEQTEACRSPSMVAPVGQEWS